MEAQAAGEEIVLVVRLQAAADGSWYLQVDDQSHVHTIPLAPATLVIRLRHLGEQGVLRGTIRLQGGDIWAPLQSNALLEELVRAWLFNGGQSMSSS
jgi:hypothetical protein